MILCLSASHKKANIPLLEALSFKDKTESLMKLCLLESVKECIIIQTCNRVEIYIRTDGRESEAVVEELLGFWSQQVGISRDVILGAIELYSGHEALNHLMSLAAGLESMVVGEDQILGQIRSAYVEAKKLKTVGKTFSTLFMKAINVGRRIRAETRLNEGQLSVSSIAVNLAEKHVGDLSSATFLLVGAGETGTIAGKELMSKGAGKILIANRTYEKGAKLANEIQGKAIKFDELYEIIPHVNVAIVATSAPKPIITFEKMKETFSKCKNKYGLLILDISQPRSVEDSVGEILHIQLRDIDDLKEIAEDNARKRLGEVYIARKIIMEELNQVEVLLKKMVSEPVITSLFQKAEEIRMRETAKAFRRLKNIDEEQLLIMETLSKVLIERILQTPMETLRLAALNGDNGLLNAAQKIFCLNPTLKKEVEVIDQTKS